MGCVVVTEVALLRKKEKTLYFWGLGAAASFMVALPFWWFEANQKWCSPHTHGLTGHVLWHFLTAGSVVFMADYYSQFRVLIDGIDEEPIRG